jgi:hypothetical protein
LSRAFDVVLHVKRASPTVLHPRLYSWSAERKMRKQCAPRDAELKTTLKFRTTFRLKNFSACNFSLRARCFHYGNELRCGGGAPFCVHASQSRRGKNNGAHLKPFFVCHKAAFKLSSKVRALPANSQLYQKPAAPVLFVKVSFAQPRN